MISKEKAMLQNLKIIPFFLIIPFLFSDNLITQLLKIKDLNIILKFQPLWSYINHKFASDFYKE